MRPECRQEALFGLYDGAVSVTGFVAGLVIHHAAPATIAVGGLGGAVAAAVSMGTGEMEKAEGSARSRLPVASAMAGATLGGSVAVVWPFFAFGRSLATWVATACCVAVALLIAHVKSRSPAVRGHGPRSYLRSLLVFGLAVGATLLVVGLIPASA